MTGLAGVSWQESQLSITPLSLELFPLGLIFFNQLFDVCHFGDGRLGCHLENLPKIVILPILKLGNAELWKGEILPRSRLCDEVFLSKKGEFFQINRDVFLIF